MSRRTRMLYAVGALALSLIFVFLFIDSLPGGAHPVIARQPDVSMPTMYTDQVINQYPVDADIRSGKISFPLSALLERKMISFEYKTATHTIPVLAYISPEGKLVTAIRVCEPCNSNTFSLEGTEMSCGNCETRWKANNLDGLQGSCQKFPPDPIPSSIIDGRVEIDVQILENWKLRI